MLFEALALIGFGIAATCAVILAHWRGEMAELRSLAMDLRRRVRDLERAATPSPTPPPQPPSVQAQAAPPPAPAPAPPPVQPPAQPTLPKPVGLDSIAPPPSPRPESDVPHAPEAPRRSLEERLGAHLFVWIGGIALVLAGAFLVKYSFDNGLLSPAVRLALGAVFGAAMIAGAEAARGRVARINEALAGAGVAVLYAVLLAGVKLYDLIGATPGFVAMAAVTVGAVTLSLRHGRFVALLGLLGGFATPALIGGTSESMGPLLAYLILLQIGLLVVTRKRGWLGLSALTLAASLLWVVLLLVRGVPHEQTAFVGLFVLMSAGAYLFSTARAAAAGAASTLAYVSAAFGVVGASSVLLGLLAFHGRFGAADFVMLGLLATASIVLARIDPRQRHLPWITLAASLVTLLAWPIALSLRNAPLDAAWYALVVGVFGGIFTLGAYASLWGTTRRDAWSVLSVAASLLFTLLAYAVLRGYVAIGFPWWLVLAGLAAMQAAAGATLWRRRDERDADAAVNAWALGAAVSLTLAAGLAFTPPWLAVAWSALGTATAAVMVRLRLTALRYPVAWLAGFAALLLIAPGPSAIRGEQGLLINLYLPAYGLPALAFAAGAWITRRGGARMLSGVHAALSAATTAGLAAILIRHGFHRGVGPGGVMLMEWGTYAVVGLALGMVVRLVGRVVAEPVLRYCGDAIAAMGLAAAVVGSAWLANPLWNAEAVGSWPVVNGLLYLYGLPVVLAGAWCVMLARRGDTAAAAGVGWCAMLLLFVLVSLQVRQAFAGPMLTLVTHPMSDAERYAYSLAWVVLGGALLAVGVWRNLAALRYASLLVMLLAVGKVFILDTAQLRDLWRVMSFLGLGLSLIALGWVYQRYVFRRAAA